MTAFVVVLGITVWVGATLLIQAWLDRSKGRRPTLVERLEPFQRSVADEAQEWLSRH